MDDDQQYVLPFTARRDELLAQVRMLRFVDLGVSPGKAEGAVEIIERLVLIGQSDLVEVDGQVNSKAQVTALAAKISGRKTVDPRTVRNWRVTAEKLGLLETQMTSQQYGGRNWNTYTIRVDNIRQLAGGGNGRKRAEMVSALRPEMISAPRAETVSALYHCITQRTHTAKAPDTQATADTQPPGVDTRRQISQGAVVCAFLDLGVGKATTLVAEALDRGCDTRSLLAIARWFERSQRRHPTRWDKPGTVLMLRLTAALPGLPAWKGWIPGTPPPRHSRRRHSADRVRAEREQQQAEARRLAAEEPSLAEQLKRGRFGHGTI